MTTPARGDRVRIWTSDCTSPAAPRDIPLDGTVHRTWGTAAVNVTVITDDGRRFTRLAADVEVLSKAATDGP